MSVIEPACDQCPRIPSGIPAVARSRDVKHDVTDHREIARINDAAWRQNTTKLRGAGQGRGREILVPGRVLNSFPAAITPIDSPPSGSRSICSAGRLW